MRTAIILLSLALAAGCHHKPAGTTTTPSGTPAGDQTMGGTTPSGASMDDPTPNSSDPNGKKPKTPEDPK